MLPQKISENIMIVDDSPINLNLLGSILSEKGYMVRQMTSGRFAIQSAETDPPDLILLDINMPEMDGFETCRHLKQIDKLKDIPIIFVSVLDEMPDKKKAFDIGGVDYITKPFEAEELLARVHTHLSLRKSRIELEETNKELRNAKDTLEKKVYERTKDLEEKSLALMGEINQRYEKESALKASEEKYRRLYNYTPVMMYSSDSEGYIIDANEHFLRSLKYPKDEVMGKRYTGFLTEASKTYVIEHIKPEFLKKGFVKDVEYQMVKKDGEIIHVSHTSVLEKDGEGNNFSFIIDTTEQRNNEFRKKELEKQLRQSQKMEAIGTLAGGIAHDFNNILSPILGYTEMLLDEAEEGSTSEKYLNQIYTAARRSRDLVQQILNFSTQSENELKPLRIHFVVQEVLKLVRSTLPSTITIKASVDKKCRPVLSDYTQIYQVAMNLITNAFHAMQNTGGTLSVSLKEVKNPDIAVKEKMMDGRSYVCLGISDTGCGMNKEVLEHIFEPYFTTKEKGKGTGLGLSVVHGIVKSLGGDIIVDSTPGKGSRFFIYFPILKTFEVEDIRDNKKDIPKGTERILLVDDDPRILALIEDMLKKLGYEVVSFSNSGLAYREFSYHPESFDLVFTDMTMPNMTGLVLADRIKEIRPNMPVIICSGFSEAISPEILNEKGVCGYLKKPILRREMAEMIRNVLDVQKELLPYQ